VSLGLVSITDLVFVGPRWRARSDGGVGCHAVVVAVPVVVTVLAGLIRFASHEGCRRCSSRNESAADIRARGKWGEGVRCVARTTCPPGGGHTTSLVATSFRLPIQGA
jgi:hypothetical protein